MSLADDSSIQILVLHTSSLLSPLHTLGPQSCHPPGGSQASLLSPVRVKPKLCSPGPVGWTLLWPRGWGAPLAGLHSGLGGSNIPTTVPVPPVGTGTWHRGATSPLPPCSIPPVLVPCPPLSPAAPHVGEPPPHHSPPRHRATHFPGTHSTLQKQAAGPSALLKIITQAVPKKEKKWFLGIFPRCFNEKRLRSPWERSHGCPSPRGAVSGRPPPPPSPAPSPGGAQIPPVLSPW